MGGGEHDWALLLGQAGWLAKDQAIRGAVYFLGFLLYVAAVLIGFPVLYPGGRPADGTGPSDGSAGSAPPRVAAGTPGGSASTG